VTIFGERLRSVTDSHGRLCLGIDPHAQLLHQWGLSNDAQGARELALRAIEVAHTRVGIVKPQVAFFERFGARGYVVLEEVIRTARETGLLVIADVKRGDIGSTAAAYGEAWLAPG
jgi:orotidine-5'-phosphate decarboxylase